MSLFHILAVITAVALPGQEMRLDNAVNMESQQVCEDFLANKITQKNPTDGKDVKWDEVKKSFESQFHSTKQSGKLTFTYSCVETPGTDTDSESKDSGVLKE